MKTAKQIKTMAELESTFNWTADKDITFENLIFLTDTISLSHRTSLDPIIAHRCNSWNENEKRIDLESDIMSKLMTILSWFTYQLVKQKKGLQ